MPKASFEDRAVVTTIIGDAFRNNPSVLATIKNDGAIQKRILALAAYAFDTAISRDGVYLSSDKQGAAICYKYNFKKESFSDYLNQLKLVLRAIGFSGVKQVLSRGAYIKKQYPKSGEFLYFWFFGVNEESRGKEAAIELKNEILRIADTNQLPIYLETSVEKNMRAYKRYGFEVYHFWKQGNKPTLWFMRRTNF